jgi:ABC-type multidrug transport system ATPase subunit
MRMAQSQGADSLPITPSTRHSWTTKMASSPLSENRSELDKERHVSLSISDPAQDEKDKQIGWSTPAYLACQSVRYSVPQAKSKEKEKKRQDKEEKGNELNADDKKPKRRMILEDVDCLFRPSRLTGVMGASGAGKTTLLTFLAGQVGPTAHVSGTATLNGHPVGARELRQASAFVFQDDVILDTMTVREAIEMSALLRLPPSKVNKEERDRRINAVIKTLQLEKCQHTRIGGQMFKGISGGERKRTAVAMELVINPSVLLLDEPTSGLDTFTAWNVIECLSDLARIHGRTVAATLHQPSSDIFQRLDDILLLSSGRIVYHGPTEQVTDYFARLGFECPPLTNPADYLFMHVLNETAAFAGETPEQIQERLSLVQSAWPQSSENAHLMSEIKAQRTEDSLRQCQRIIKESASRRAPFGVQFTFLARRCGRNMIRNVLLAGMRLIQMLCVGLVMGGIFYDVRSKPAMAQSTNRVGSLVFYAINLFMSSAMGVVTTFVAEKNVVQRERTAGYYQALPFFLAKVLVELPVQLLTPLIALAASYFLIGYRSGFQYFFWAYLAALGDCMAGVGLGTFVGCLFGNITLAMVVLSTTLLPFIVFSGMIVNNHTLPWVFRWMPYICPTWYTFLAFARNELTDYIFPTCTPPKIPTIIKRAMPEMYIDCTGNSTLKINDLNLGPSYAVCLLALLSMYVVLMLAAYATLWYTGRVRSPRQKQ